MSATDQAVDSGRSARANPWPALAAVLVAAFMDYLDVSIITAAVPTIQRDLGASDAAAQWIVAGYTLPFALMLITGGRLGDLYGRKRTFLTGVVGFTVASALCGLAASPGMLIGGRVLQGLSAAVMIPQVFATIQVLFPPERRAGAFSAFAGVTAIASVAGAPLGGLLIEANLFGLEWRTVFLINVPIGVLTLIAVALLLKESWEEAPPRLDLAGFAVVTVGLLLLMFPLVQGADLGWPAWTVVAMVVGVVVLALFVVVEKRVAASGGTPLVQIALFRQRSFLVGIIAILVFFAGVNSFFFLFFIYLQEGLGFSVVGASLVIVSWPLAIGVASTIAARWAYTHGPAMLTAGSLIMAAATVGTLFVVSSAGGALAGWEVVPTFVLTGIGMGLVAPTLMGVIVSGVQPRDAGSASGVLTSTIQLGASVGIAVAGVVFFALLTSTSGVSGSAATVAAALPGQARGTAFTDAIVPTLWFHVGAYLLTGLLSLLLRKPAGGGAQQEDEVSGEPAPDAAS